MIYFDLTMEAIVDIYKNVPDNEWGQCSRVDFFYEALEFFIKTNGVYTTGEWETFLEKKVLSLAEIKKALGTNYGMIQVKLQKSFVPLTTIFFSRFLYIFSNPLFCFNQSLSVFFRFASVSIP